MSQECWLLEEWLDTGVALLTTGSFDFARDFLLPLPSQNLEAATHRRALYSDSAAFSQKLYDSLVGEQEQARLPAYAGRFWTEHSDRAGLDSWASALGVQESERNFLGRWAPRGAADAYVRTHATPGGSDVCAHACIARVRVRGSIAAKPPARERKAAAEIALRNQRFAKHPNATGRSRETTVCDT